MKKILGFLAVAGLLFVAAPSGSAQAMPLANPAAAAGQVADGVTTVDWRRVPTVPYSHSHRHRYRHNDHRWHRRPVHRHYNRHYHRRHHR